MKQLTIQKLGKATVIVDIVDKGNVEIRPAYAMNPTEIAVHNTGNSGRGANAEMHNRYIHNMSELPASATGYASWHFSVDENFIYQHIPLDETAWHTGDGFDLKSGNKNAIGIEICEHVDQKNYAQAEENAIALIAHLVKVLNIDVKKVKPHQAYSGKFCPRVILKRDGGFSKFHKRVVEASTVKPVVKGIQKEGVRMFKPSTKTLENEMVKFLELAYKEGILSSDEWAKKAKEGQLSLDDAIALTATLYNRKK